jgi:hypothetical protein
VLNGYGRFVQARFAARTGFAGGGSAAGAAQFERLGRIVGGLLELLVSCRAAGGRLTAAHAALPPHPAAFTSVGFWACLAWHL